MAKLKNESGSMEEVPSGITTVKEADLLDIVQSLKNEVVEANRKIGELSRAADPNRLQAVRQADRKDSSHFLVGIPSLDKVDPIVVWEGYGSVILREGMEVDTQGVKYRTLNGKEGKLDYKTFMQQINRYSIKAITNDLKSFRDRDGFKRHEEKMSTELVNVTLSEDDGLSYAGASFDIPYAFLNAGSLGKVGGEE